MKSTLQKSLSKVLVFAVVMLFISIQSSAQTWGYRNGYGSGNPGAEAGHAIATDASGNVYITGSMVAPAGPNGINFGGGATTGYGQLDGYVASFTSAGVFRWAMSFGSALNDQGRGIIVDNGSVYVAGNHGNATLNISNNATTYPPAGGNGGIIMSLNSGTGAFNWLTRFDGSGGGEITQALCVDASNNLYASGNFSGTVSFGPFSRTASGAAGTDMFVVKLNSTGTVQWASTGGAPGFNDNAGGSGVCFMPGTNQILMGGSFSDAAATYGAFTIPHNGGNEICLVELNAGTGAFENAIGVAGSSSTGVDEIYSVAYDPSTTDVVVSGGFDSPTLTFGTNPVLTNSGGTGFEGFYARYTPGTNTWVWSKVAASSAGSGDRVRGIRPDGSGALYITGNFDGTLSLATSSTPLSITNNRTSGDDIFIARIKASDGNAQLLGHGAGDNTTGTSFSSNAIALGTNGAWITGSYTTNITFAPLTALASISNAADVVLARYNTPAPIVANPSQTPITCNVGCNATATVAPTGGVTPYTYAWSPSGGTAATATGLCAGNYTVTITDNIGTQITQNFTIAQPALTMSPVTTQNAAFPISTTNTNIADASCRLIATLLPNGGTPVTGNVNGRVWVQASVPTFGGKPYVQRHYEITPATNPSTATGRVTLYFSQAEFNNFNAHAGSSADLPTGPGDNVGKANLRVEKRNGQTNDGTGTPGSYTGARSIIDPADANIVWNATASRWEVTFDITAGMGWSGFFVHTSLVVLPVNLLSFNGLIVNNDVQLKWQTGGETNNDHFEVERSTDGVNYTSIGQLPGNNGVGTRDYNLLDAGAATLQVNKLFYRLKIVETGGRSEYSNIVVVYLNKKGGFVTSIMPNPFGPTLGIAINAPKNGKMNLTVVDATGRVVLQQQSSVNKGFSTQPVNDAAKLSTGVYTLLVEFDGISSTYKIVKQ